MGRRLKYFSKQLLQASARYGGWSNPAPTCSNIHKSTHHLKVFSHSLLNFLDEFSPAMAEAVFSATLAEHTNLLIDERLSNLARHGPYNTGPPLGVRDGTCNRIGELLTDLRSDSETSSPTHSHLYTTRTPDQLRILRSLELYDSPSGCLDAHTSEHER